MTQTKNRRGIKLKDTDGTDSSYQQANLKTNAKLNPFELEVVKRLRRIETRLVGGMEELGVGYINHNKGIVVSTEHDPNDQDGVGIITITSLGTTVGGLLDALKGETGVFDISYNGKIKCQICVGFDPMKVVL
jgi:hypothetical protein